MTEQHTTGTGQTTEDHRDVVLVTVDAWRYDALARMSTLQRMIDHDSYDSTVAISHSAATHGAFPPLLASQHLVQAYDSDGQVADETRTLPDVLAAQGYSTGALVASNPFLAKWAEYFDHFWNDGMGTSVEYSGSRYTKFDKAQRFLRLKQRVSSDDIASRAKRWYCQQDGPRFLWMHVMDIHGPYFPGFSGGRAVGLYETYRTLFDYHVRDDTSQSVLEGLRALYEQCVTRLDEQLQNLFEFIDSDAIVVVTGDHGEEFDHGFHGHAQLYDECVKTPLLTRNLGCPVSERYVRHIDLAPSVLDELDISIPNRWNGRPVDGEPRTALLCNHAPLLNRTYVGVRTEQYKFIKSFHDERWTVEDRELYDLGIDPEERDPIDAPELAGEFETIVDNFLDTKNINISTIRGTQTGIDDEVEGRLEELGYL